MSVKEVDRISVLERLKKKEIKQHHAAQLIDVSVRQIRRLIKTYKREGAAGLIHKLRGTHGNRAIAQKEKDRMKDLIQHHYPDFGPNPCLGEIGRIASGNLFR